MKIICPACSADYAIANDMLGPNGRKVKCATCSHVWRALPEPEEEIVSQEDASFEAEETVSDEQAAIDRAMAEMEAGDDGSEAFPQTTMRARREEDTDPFDVEEVVASGPVGAADVSVDPGVRRRVRLKGSGPSKFGIFMRMALKVATPVAVAAGLAGLAFAIPAREAVVRALPDTAKLYAMIGLPVNVRGVEFSQFTAERSTVAGLSVLTIEGSVSNVVDRSVPLGPLRLALMGGEGQELFVWRVQPTSDMLDPEQTIAIASELTAPPPNVNGVAVRFLQDGERIPGQLQ